MSTVNGLNSNSNIYNPTLIEARNESSLLQSFNSSSNSSTPDLISLSSELNQINQGIDLQEAAKYETQASSNIVQGNPQYSSVLSNYTTGLNLMQNISGSSTNDSIISLSNQLNLLNEGMSENEIQSVGGMVSQNSATSDIITLGEELNQLNSNININSTKPPVLNYNYSPSTGITTNTSNNSTGSKMDLVL